MDPHKRSIGGEFRCRCAELSLKEQPSTPPQPISHWSPTLNHDKKLVLKISPKYLDRHVQEFAARHSMHEHNTIDIIGAVADGGVGKRLRYRELIPDHGLASGARS